MRIIDMTHHRSIAQISRIKPIKWTCKHYTTSGGRLLTEHEFNVLIRMLGVPCKTSVSICNLCYDMTVFSMTPRRILDMQEMD